ncbi:non-hydrolyzing UDP-N-acetylglucosamine 2-epimerase [Rhodoblastus sp.]|uniref:non-hydrolyzing UDP-N-acetylglucosamine 2-epimerase n=1 Tax=Rhodoblastus sp. TaxID=1962975 RepID=UPI003F9C603E
MRKVMTIVGTRPELIKMCCVIERLDRETDHVLVHTGQNYDYELNQVFFDDLDIRRPDHFLSIAGQTTAQTIGNAIVRVDEVLELEKPDAFMIYGDTNSGLAVIAAKRRKVPIFHMEAGNRCFDQRVPEELNRKVIDHLADVNMVLSEHARRYLLAEGLPGERIFKTGSHLDEVFQRFLPKIEASTALKALELEKGGYFLVSSHREENVDDPGRCRALIGTLNALADSYQVPIIFSTHPRTRSRLDAIDGMRVDPLVRFLRPFGFSDYVRLQRDAKCVLSDSGTITEEASLLGLRAVNLRDAHERPEGIDAGVLIMCGVRPEAVLDAVRVTLARRPAQERKAGVVDDYFGGCVSEKVVNIVLSYIDYVNRTVWSK